jgi:hypothetical protein
MTTLIYPPEYAGVEVEAWRDVLDVSTCGLFGGPSSGGFKEHVAGAAHVTVRGYLPDIDATVEVFDFPTVDEALYELGRFAREDAAILHRYGFSPLSRALPAWHFKEVAERYFQRDPGDETDAA